VVSLWQGAQADTGRKTGKPSAGGGELDLFSCGLSTQGKTSEEDVTKTSDDLFVLQKFDDLEV